MGGLRGCVGKRNGANELCAKGVGARTGVRRLPGGDSHCAEYGDEHEAGQQFDECEGALGFHFGGLSGMVGGMQIIIF